MTSNTIPQTQNREWGFFGTINHHGDPEIAWPIAINVISDATALPPDAVAAFLDSRYGRHFADAVSNHLAAGTALAVAVGWPLTTSGASGIAAFVVKPGVDLAAVRRQLKETLPAVMVPKDIHVIAKLPLNVNGKVDRKALLASLHERSAKS